MKIIDEVLLLHQTERYLKLKTIVRKIRNLASIYEVSHVYIIMLAIQRMISFLFFLKTNLDAQFDTT